MYPWLTHTWNPIRGKCPHSCVYCSIEDMARRFKKPQLPIRLDETELKTNLGEGNYIFVGSSTDMFAKEVPSDWIYKVLEYCKDFDNKYLFQSKNPERFQEFIHSFPKNTILGTTLETNRDEKISKAPSPYLRKQFMVLEYDTMVSIEPVIDFDLDVMIKWIKEINPEFVSIGADSKGHGLPEPSWKKVQELIKGLKGFTEIKIKDNLERLNK